MRSAALAGLLLVAPALAGCLSDGGPGPDDDDPGRTAAVRDPATVWPLLSQPVFDAVTVEHDPLPSFDGKTMDSWVYRPDTPAGTTVPVIINFSPYWGNLAPAAGEEGDGFSQYLIEYYVPRGYAVVLTSVRGTGESEGCFDLGGRIERDDAVAVIERYAAADWSNGNVAAGGKSYDGTTPQGAAIEAPPALKAIVPVSGISELYKYTYKGGIPYGGLHGAAFNARYVATVGWGVLDLAEGRPGSLKPDDACPDFAVISASGVASAATGDYSDYWQERDYDAGASGARAALFLIHGLQDWNVKPDNVWPWIGDYAGPKKVWLHQWIQPEDRGTEGGHVYPLRTDWNYTMLRFLDHTLKGIDTGLFDEPPVQVEDTDGLWRHESAWPPAAALPARFHLGSTGAGMGVLGPDAGDGTLRSFTDDGRQPDPRAEDATNQLLYESGPLAADLRIAGVPVVHASVSSDRPVGKVAVTLFDVDASGTAQVIDWGGLNLRHREDTRAPQTVEAGATYEVAIEMFPQDTVVHAGHRLVLALAGNGGFPGSGYVEFEELPFGSAITVVEDATSYLELPVQPVASLTPESPQPEEAPFCWAC